MITSKSSPSEKSHPWWQWFNTLSLDAPLIAVMWMGLYAFAYRLYLPISAYILLGGTVWWLYLADRCADVGSNPSLRDLTRRHHFYAQHRKGFCYLVLPIVALGILWGSLTHLPTETLFRALALAFCVGVYFLAYVLNGKGWFNIALTLVLAVVTAGVLTILPIPSLPKFLLGGFVTLILALSMVGKLPAASLIPKELIAAYLFSIGTLLNIRLYVEPGNGPWYTEPAILFSLVCFMNLVLISHADREIDRASNQRTLLSSKNQKLLFWMTAGIVLIGSALLGKSLKSADLPLALAYGTSALGLCVSFLNSHRFSPRGIHFQADAWLILGAAVGIACSLLL